MKKSELKRLILECLKEDSQNEGFFDTIKHLGKQAVTGAKDQYNKAVVSGSKDEFARIRATVLDDLVTSYKKAQSVGARAKMTPQSIKKAYVSALTGILDKIKTGRI